MGFNMTQTIEGVRITRQLERLLIEAHRRYINFQGREGKRIDEAWIGLGCKSTYRPATGAGVMEFIHDYAPRCPGWLKFTDKGLRIFTVWCALRLARVEGLNDYESLAA